MTPTLNVLQGHALERLREIPDETVDSCVTSPAYWGLRDYGTPPVVFGGRPDCPHDWQEEKFYVERSAAQSSGEAFSDPGPDNAKRLKDGRWRSECTCPLCGAWRGHLGMEKTYQRYVANMTEIFREVRRILKPAGTLWLNLGDCYYSGNRGGYRNDGTRWSMSDIQSHNRGNHTAVATNRLPQEGLKDKDLVGIPWRVAFALQADGWWLRSQIPWVKRNCMPESTEDRPTSALEYVFLMAKSANYHYDHKAIGVAQAEHERTRRLKEQARGLSTTYKIKRDEVHGQHPPGKNGCAKSVKSRQRLAQRGWRNRRNTDWLFESFNGMVSNEVGEPLALIVNPAQYKGAHFATFPKKLVEPMILAGTPPGGTVIDIFGGSGTVGAVALELGRNAILIELNPEYVKLINERCSITPGLPLA